MKTFVRMSIFLVLIFSNLTVSISYEKEPMSLDAVIVTATKLEKKESEIPNTVNTITSKDIQEYKLSRTLPDVFKEIPSIMVQKTAYGQGSPFIRGFTGFRTLFLIDGIRLNNSVFRDGPNQYWNTIDPLSIEQLEIIKGPIGVLYGSDAIGGTVNAITKAPIPYKKGLKYWKRRIYYRFANAEDSHVIRSEIEGRIEKFGFIIGGDAKNFGDLDAGKHVGLQPKTGYDERDLDVKLVYNFTSKLTLTFGHQFVKQDDIWRTHKTIYGISWEGTTIGTEKERILKQKRRLTYLKYDWELDKAFMDSITLNVSYHTQEEEQYRVKSNNKKDLQGFTVDTLGIYTHVVWNTDYGKWLYGVEYYHDYVDSFKEKYNADGTLDKIEIQGPVGDDSDYSTLGIFIQNDIFLTEDLNVIVGARYSHISAKSQKVKDPKTGNQMSISKDWDNIIGSLRAMYYLGEERQWRIFSGISQGFRAPNLSDLTRFDTARTNEIETPSPNINPEKFISYEIGAKHKRKDMYMQIAYYYTYIDDMIIRTPTGNIVDNNYEVTKKNGGNGYIEGIEGSINYKLNSDIRSIASFSWMDGKIETYPTSSPVKHREPVSRLMPTTLNLAFRWEPEKKPYWIEISSSMVKRQHNLSTRDQRDTQRIPPNGTPGYVILNIRTGWQFRRGMKLCVALENITDKDYRIHGSGQNEAGRNFIVAFDWQF